MEIFLYLCSIKIKQIAMSEKKVIIIGGNNGFCVSTLGTAIMDILAEKQDTNVCIVGAREDLPKDLNEVVRQIPRSEPLTLTCYEPECSGYIDSVKEDRKFYDHYYGKKRRK